MRRTIQYLLLGLLAGSVLGAPSPDRLNYQGVLRDSTDHPIDTTYNVVFRIYDAEVSGSEVLVDQHLIAGTGGVTFDNGLFNAEIGGGNVLDGSGPGVYTSLREVFRDYSNLWLDLEINGEVLSPRLPILAAGHAMNAEHADNASALGGLGWNSFLNTSASTQTKSGGLNVNGEMAVGGNLDVGGNRIEFASGTWLSSEPSFSILQAGDATTDDLYLQAGSGSGNGRIVIQGESEMRFRSGDGSYKFWNSSEEKASLNSLGDLQIDGSLDFGGELRSPAGANISASPDFLRLEAGQTDGDDLYLVAGNDDTDGRIGILGDGAIDLAAGNGLFQFRNAANGVERASLDAAGNLQIDGSLQIDGNLTVDGGTFDHQGDLQLGGDLQFDAGAWIDANAANTFLKAGDAPTDDLYLEAGNGTSNGRILIEGNGPMTLASGNDNFSFLNASNVERASLSNGTLNLGGDLEFFSGPRIFHTIDVLSLQAGQSPTDRLQLAAGHDLNNTRIFLTGNGGISSYAESGDFRFFDGANVERASLTGSGNLQIDGDLTVSGNDVSFGGGAGIVTNTIEARVEGGNNSTTDLHLRASSLLSTYGRISINGNSAITLEPGNGQVLIYQGGQTRAFFDGGGNLDIDGRLDMDAGDIYMVETGVDQTQDIHFREAGVASGERFEWDDVNNRFEVSDDYHVYGSLTATTKNFVQNHPYREDLEIVYTSLEGDEATAFTRGFGKLENGETRIELGETFAYVTNPDVGLSAHLTPRGEWADLYVAELSAEELVVRAAPGAPDVAFDYIVLGLRIGHEDFPVLRPKRSESYLPPDGAYDEDRGFDAELREASAMRRYLRMTEERAGEAEIDFSRAEALKQAIGQRPVQFDYPVGSTRSVAEILAEQEGEAEGSSEPDALATEEAPATTSTDRATNEADAAAARDVYAASFRPAASELATMLPAGEALGRGDVVSIDPITGSMVLARLEGDRAVFGVVAAEPGVVLGAQQPGEVSLDDAPVVTSGIVLCNVDATYGAVDPGDLLITSETPGYARRTDEPAPGTVLGKALDPLEVGTGTIRVLVTLH